MNIGDFCHSGSTFDLRYAEASGDRWPTFKAAMNLLVQRSGRTIVETGCVRQRDDWGAGYSTVIFGDLVQHIDGRLFTVDNNPAHMDLCKAITQDTHDRIVYTVADSVQFLGHEMVRLDAFRGRRIDLLYLDSLDFPLVEEDGPVDPPQDHCAREFVAALPWMHSDSVLLIDDSDLPSGGKPGKLRHILPTMGWECVLDIRQSLWIKKA